MNRKNLTAAVLAGLAGVAGLAGAAQAGIDPAVNLNPDGLGEVLLYPYYTTNDGNTTLITVVNTTDAAKAVKVRFLEGYNSREVLDFNLYLSEYDVWVAALADSEAFGAEPGVPHLFTPDTSCTVPYLYGYGVEDGLTGGLQALLPFAFTGKFEDGGPTDISRAAEGYLEIIEMGEMTGLDGRAANATLKITKRLDSATAATHTVKKDEDGNEYIEPNDCWLLEDNWTEYLGTAEGPDDWSGWWLNEALANCDEDTIDDVDPDDVGVTNGGTCGRNVGNSGTWDGPDVNSLTYNTGGLFGGAAIINVAAGTMVSYDARAVQGYAIEEDGLHFYPGTIHPSLNDGNVNDAIVFLGQGQTKRLDYSRGVDAISAVFMHDEIANTYVIEEEIAAATEWVVTFPTKAWYADTLINNTAYSFYKPDVSDTVGCNSWKEGDVNPFQSVANGGGFGANGEVCTTPNPNGSGDWYPSATCDWPTYPDGSTVWEFCDTVKNTDTDTVAPFTTTFDGDACEPATLAYWDREESPVVKGGSVRPPIVSPAPPVPPGQKEAPFELCYEVNVLRFGEGSVFGGASVLDGGLALEVGLEEEAGWARITLAGDDGVNDCVACGKKSDGYPEQHVDAAGMRGLPVTGFAAETYTNGNVQDGVLANYGGLFNHKGSVRCDDLSDSDTCSSAVR